MPFAEPDWIDDDGHEDTDQWSSQPVGSTAMLFADPEWIDDDESHEESESWSSQPVEGTATPAAEFLGPMQGQRCIARDGRVRESVNAHNQRKVNFREAGVTSSEYQNTETIQR